MFNLWIVMRKYLYFAFFICFCFVGSYAQQDCEVLLQSARQYKAQGKYDKAVEKYELLNKKCPNLVDKSVQSEWKYCTKKLEGPRTPPPPKQPTSGGDHITLDEPGGYVSNTKLYFNAEGGCRNKNSSISVNLSVVWDFDVPEDCRNWLEVHRSGNTLDVSCQPNPNATERHGRINIIGEINEEIAVHQESRKTSSRTPTQTDAEKQTEEWRLMAPVIVSFKAGKAIPIFENVGKMIGHLEDYKNIGLQIEAPWCKNRYNARLIEKRINNITKYFVHSGIAKERIVHKITYYSDVEEGTANCDCAIAKLEAIEGFSDNLSKTKILFDKNKDIPIIEDYNDNINRTVATLNANPQLKLVIDVYACGIGWKQRKRELAQRRANNVRELFMKRGLSSDQIEIATYTTNDSQISHKAKECNCAVFRVVKR
jgi:hypothetical protein